MPTAEELFDKLIGLASLEDPGLPTVVAKKILQHRVTVDDSICDKGLSRGLIGCADTEEKAGQPIGEAAAEDQKVLAVQGSEKISWPARLGLQCVYEIEDIFLCHGIIRNGLDPAQKVIDGCSTQGFPVFRDVSSRIFWSIGKDA